MNIVLAYKGRYVVRQAQDLETLAAVLRGRGHAVSLVYDPGTFGVTDNILQVPSLAGRWSTPRDMARRVAAKQPDIVVVSALPSTFRFFLDAARAVKKRCSAPIVFMGLHPTLAPESVMSHACVDYVIEGEAEQALPDFVDMLQSGRSLDKADNLWRREGGEILHGPMLPPVDLDALPLPDKDLFYPHENQRFSYVAMVSRGCPFPCTYCEETCIKKKYGPGYFPRKSVGRVIRELETAKLKYGFREVIFKDSYLSGDEAWLEELMVRYRRAIRLPFKCFCTISGFGERTADLLKKGGCYGIEFGLQTWNETIRREVLRRRETNEQARRVFEICAKRGLWYDVDHMFNLPGESLADHALGAREYSRLEHLNRIKIHYLLYLPTAPIVEKGLESGALSQDRADALANGTASDFYDSRHADPRQRELAAGFAALYKILPLLPRKALPGMLREGRLKALGKTPAPLMAALQGVRALQTKDLRFAFYLRRYPVQVLQSGFARWGL